MAVVSILRKLPRYTTSPRGGVPAGLRPSYNIDFTRNRAEIGGKVTTIADIPSISGTLALSASGHLVSGAANGLIIPLSGVTYPLTMVFEYVRTVDSGAIERICCIDDGDATDFTEFRISAADQGRVRVTAASLLQADVVGGPAATLVDTVYRAAWRVATNSVQAARSPTGTLGTEDTAVTLPANPTRWVGGVDSAGAQTFTGYLRRFKIYPGAATDAQLAALATVA